MYVPDDYYDAARWLMNSKRVVDRGVRRTMYSGYYRASLVRRSPDSIAVHVPWLGQDLLTYHSDGTSILKVDTVGRNPLRSQGVRNFVRQIAGFTNVYQRNYKFYITENNYKFTPSKIQGCRACSSSGKVDGLCQPLYCHNQLSGVCEEHPDKTINAYGWHTMPCPHGRETNHVLYKSRDCWSCNGAGKREYGLQPISLMWDGSPIRIKNGDLVKREPSELEKRIAAYVNPFD
jgi:hypothetical protein